MTARPRGGQENASADLPRDASVIVVSDTSPLNHLILIGAIESLPSLFDQVIIPESVASELAHARAPEDVRTWIAGPPSWLEVRAPEATDPIMMLDLASGAL